MVVVSAGNLDRKALCIIATCVVLAVVVVSVHFYWVCLCLVVIVCFYFYQWLSQTILVPVAKEIKSINASLKKMGSTEFSIGSNQPLVINSYKWLLMVIKPHPYQVHHYPISRT